MSLDLHIGFSRTNSFISRAFQWFLKGKISHSFILVNLSGFEFVVGADDQGLHWQLLDVFKSKSKIVALFKPVHSLDESFRYMVNQYNLTEYDYWAAGAIGVRNRFKLLWKWFGTKLRSLASSSKLTCMEFVTRILALESYNIVDGKDLEMFDTQQLLLAMQQDKSEFISIDTDKLG